MNYSIDLCGDVEEDLAEVSRKKGITRHQAVKWLMKKGLSDF